MKKHKYEVQGDLFHPTDTAWGSEADYFHRMTGETIEYCRDFVILRYLFAGDTRPLAALLASGCAPGPAVLRHLSAMLQPADGTEDKVPFRLNIKDRLQRKGPRSDPEIAWRNFLISKNVEREMDEGAAGYDGRGRPAAAAACRPGRPRARQWRRRPARARRTPSSP